MTELPAGWAWATLADVVGSDGVFSDGDWVETKDQDPNGEVRLIQLADIGEGVFRDRSSRFLTTESAERLACTYLEPGDVLVARMPDPLGRACLYPGSQRRAVTAVDVCIVRPGSGSVDTRWLMWCLNSPQFREEVGARQSGTTRKRISRKNLAAIQFPLPPLAEQRRIVAAVEQHLSRLDAAVGLVGSASARLENLRATAIDSAFVASWPRVPLAEIAEIVGGVTKDSKRQQDDDPDLIEVPYLRVANVQRGFLDLRTMTTIRVPSKTVAKLELRSGDVLFNEGGDRDKLGRGCVWSGQIPRCIHQNHVFRARLRDGFEPRFVSWWGNSFGREWFWRHGRQTTNLASMSLSTLKAFPVAAPPLDKQHAAVDKIESRLSAIDHLDQVVRASQVRAATLRRSILARAFRGELVPQDTNDPPASVLLDRIAAERTASSAPARKRRLRTPA